jgi:hypothetical protein
VVVSVRRICFRERWETEKSVADSGEDHVKKRPFSLSLSFKVSPGGGETLIQSAAEQRISLCRMHNKEVHCRIWEMVPSSRIIRTNNHQLSTISFLTALGYREREAQY